MLENKTILAVVAARGGSKGVPRKNLKLAGGKPLIAWIIETAKKSSYIDRLILSSEDDEIIETAKMFGCEVPFVRPAELSKDDSSVSDVILHAVKHIPGFDYIMLLQPTSPLTRTKDIDGCIQHIIRNDFDSVVSITRPEKSPYWVFSLEDTHHLKPIFGDEYLTKRRQDLPPAFIPTGAVYMAKTQWFLMNRSFYGDNTGGYMIPCERSLDIDTQLDFKMLEALIADE